MPSGIETPNLGVDPTVDPIILVVMLVAFLIGAVGPFALCVIGSIRDERAMRRYAADGRDAATRDVDVPATVANPVAATVVPAAATLQPATLPVARVAANDAAANDDATPARAVRS